MPTDPSAPAEDAGRSWYQSRTVWGSLIAMAAGLAGVFGKPVDPGLLSNAVDLLTTAGGLVGGGLALYGRAKASGPLVS
jgi:hypothetical protein